MSVMVRYLDAAATHLKRRAESIGLKVLAKGGGSATEIMDGFIARAVGNRREVAVTLIGMPATLSAMNPNFVTLGGASRLVRELRIQKPLARRCLDVSGTPEQFSLDVAPEDYRPFQSGVALVAGSPFPSIASGSFSTTDVNLHPGVALSAQTRTGESGGNWYVDTIIYRSTAGRKALDSTETANVIEYRASGPTSAGELAYVILDAASMGFSPGTPSEPVIASGARATELSPGDGIVATQIGGIAYFARYSVNFETSKVLVKWRFSTPSAGVAGIFSGDGMVRALVRTNLDHRLLAIDPESGAVSISSLWLSEDDGYAYNITPYSVDGQPWFFCPRRIVPDDVASALRYWTPLESLDAVLVSPAGAVIPVSTSGFYVQRGTNRTDRAGASDDGTVATAEIHGSALADRVAWYGTITFPEFGVSNACVYAPGILALVVCPNSDYPLESQRRFVALVSATTGALLSISPAPFAQLPIWHGISLSCYEQGTVDDSGNLQSHGAMLISVGRLYVPSLDAGPPSPSTLGVFVTHDAGATAMLLYRPSTYSAMAPTARVVYLGSPLLPASIGRTRRQWLKSPL